MVKAVPSLSLSLKTSPWLFPSAQTEVANYGEVTNREGGVPLWMCDMASNPPDDRCIHQGEPTEQAISGKGQTNIPHQFLID